jgi:anti-sigma B factor antagonist
MMNIIHNKNESALVISLEGRLDTITAPELEEFLKSNLTDVNRVTINCEKLDYVSSAGLRVLLALNKKTKNNLCLEKVQNAVMEILEITGFVNILEIR